MTNPNDTRDALVDAAIQRIESASLAEYPRKEISLIDVHTVIVAYRLGALAAVQPAVEIRLFDSQWVSIVHNPEVLSTDKEQAVSIAVELTEKAMARNYADDTWPPATQQEPQR